MTLPEFYRLAILYRELLQRTPGSPLLAQIEAEQHVVDEDVIELFTVSNLYSPQTKEILFPFVFPPDVLVQGDVLLTNSNAGHIVLPKKRLVAQRLTIHMPEGQRNLAFPAELRVSSVSINQTVPGMEIAYPQNMTIHKASDYSKGMTVAEALEKEPVCINPKALRKYFRSIPELGGKPTPPLRVVDMDF